MLRRLRGCQALPLPRPSGNLRRMPPPTVFPGLGSNMGDREANLAGAQRALHPVLGLSAAQLLTRCPDESQVVLHRARGDGAA